MSDIPEENAAVEQLLAERDALHGWLERLDAASVAAPAAVRDRVRQDYQRRLDQLTSALREHGSTIQEKLAADRSEQAELTSRTEAAREALSEIELRHAVGEYPLERFEAERRGLLSDIETFELSLAAVNQRVGRMEEVLAHVERAPRAPDLEADEPLHDAASMSILDLAPAGESAGGGESLLEVVESVEVVEPTEGGADGLLATEDESERILSIFNAGGQPVAPPPVSTPDFGPLSFRPSGSVPAREPTPIGLPPDSPPRFVRPGDRLAPTTPPAPAVPPAQARPAAAAPTPEPLPEPSVAAGHGLFSEEIVATGPAPTASTAVGRTLRCGECGAMNRPLEWYCEKCGAELTAV